MGVILDIPEVHESGGAGTILVIVRGGDSPESVWVRIPDEVRVGDRVLFKGKVYRLRWAQRGYSRALDPV